MSSVPIQRTILAGSVRNSNNTYGGASILISRSTSSVLAIAIVNAPPVLGLDLTSEGLESLAPEFIEERAQLSYALGAGSVDPSRAVAALAHETRLVEHPQVLRDRLPCDIE